MNLEGDPMYLLLFLIILFTMVFISNKTIIFEVQIRLRSYILDFTTNDLTIKKQYENYLSFS
jgi:hypothetical protein